MTVPKTATAAARPASSQREGVLDGAAKGCSESAWGTSGALISIVFMFCLHSLASRLRRLRLLCESSVNKFVVRLGCWLSVRNLGPPMQQGEHRRNKYQCG